MPLLIECSAEGCVKLGPLRPEPAFQGLADFLHSGSATGAAPQGHLRLEPQDDPWAVRACFDRLILIAVHFPEFTDGRGFSTARILRQLGWQGPLRASGELLPDQWLALIRVGFDQIEVERATATQARDMLATFSASYQPHYTMPGTTRIQVEASRDLR